MLNILLVEDDVETTKLLRLYFHSQKTHNLITCATGNAAMVALVENEINLVILDISLPDITGLEICKHLRDEGSTVPIIMLTSRSEEADKVLAFELGADDYVTKPFGSMEFMARIKALLRRSELSHTETTTTNKNILCKEMVIDIDKRKATVRGERLNLTHKEFDLLALLASNPGKTFERAELLETIWGHEFIGYVNTITAHINRLRNKLEADIHNPEYILTSWGTGYRFSE